MRSPSYNHTYFYNSGEFRSCLLLASWPSISPIEVNSSLQKFGNHIVIQEDRKFTKLETCLHRGLFDWDVLYDFFVLMQYRNFPAIFRNLNNATNYDCQVIREDKSSSQFHIYKNTNELWNLQQTDFGDCWTLCRSLVYQLQWM